MSENHPDGTAIDEFQHLVQSLELDEDLADGVPVALPSGVASREIFERMVHRHGTTAKPKYLTYRAGEIILPQGGEVRSLLLMRFGEVDLSIGDATVSVYIANRAERYGASPIISAADYCYSTPSSYTATALTDVEILAIDTRVLLDMGKRQTILLLCRNLLLFSDMAVAMRKKIDEEFERTGLPCFAPDLPEDLILRLEPANFEEYYLDFASRAMAELMVGRIYRSRAEMRSTAIVALPRQTFPLTGFKNF